MKYITQNWLTHWKAADRSPSESLQYPVTDGVPDAACSVEEDDAWHKLER